MSLTKYRDFNFRQKTLKIIDIANVIISEYQAEGYDLTLRQLYYQFVARDYIPNTESEYSKLGNIVSNGRVAGLIDWDSIVDRTRNVNGNSHFDSPVDILSIAAKQYKLDTRSTQDTYIEVWIEKEALLGVIERICRQLDVTYLACRGYYSQSAMWRAAERVATGMAISKEHYIEHGLRKAVVFHLGDHDPSGLDMTRDIQDRFRLFGVEPEVQRIALNMDQVEEYNPPPNPAKLTDSRFGSYMREYGTESWELDALDPKVITALIKESVDEHTDQGKRQIRINKQEKDRAELRSVADNWDD